MIHELEIYSQEKVFHIHDEQDYIHVGTILESISSIFTQEEKKALNFYTVFMPSLLGPLVDQATQTWDPLNSTFDDTSNFLFKVLGLCSKSSSAGQWKSQVTLLEQLFVIYLLPRIKRDLESSSWDPVKDAESAVNLYESLLSFMNSVDASEPLKQTSDESSSVFASELHVEGKNRLGNMIKDTIFFDVIYPKLSQTLKGYKGESANDSLDKWIIPWLPHLNYRSLLENMLPELKRKLHATILHASKSTQSENDELFFHHTCDIVLKPWVEVIHASSMHTITSNCVAPRLGRALSRIVFEKDFYDQDLTFVTITMQYYELGLLSESVYLSMVEGEVLRPFAYSIYNWLKNDQTCTKNAALLYCHWRRLFFRKCQKASNAISTDTMICRIFYGILLMINAVSIGDISKLDELEPSPPFSTTYQAVEARRAKEKRLEEEEKELAGKADPSTYSRRQHVVSRGATFKDVVEDFAHHNHIPFHPKLGPNTMTKDGKIVYIFGNAQIFIDTNVVFVLRGGDWKPVSLNELLNLA
jgi:GC-rich sequence DNA-binding factor-like protein.